MGNYLFQIGEYHDKNFLGHNSVFVYLILIQGFDMFLTFFKIVKVEGMKPETDPKQIIINYLKLEFYLDFVSVLPWNTIRPSLIYLRYLKVMKFMEY
jgi:hypothetical protein